MADSTTTAYGLVQPEVGASADTWGEKINNDLQSLDTIVDAIGGKTAAGIALTPKGSNIEYKEFNGKLYSIDKTTGKLSEVTGTGMGEKEREAISKARTEFTALPPVKEFNLITSAYGRIITSAKEPTAAGDLALIFNYMKMLDPGSTVREGEFANAQNAGGVDTRARSLYNNIREGTRLTAGQRDDFAKRAVIIPEEASALTQFEKIDIPFVKHKKLLLPEGRTMFTQKDKIEINHGGISLEEIVVPFITVIK